MDIGRALWLEERRKGLGGSDAAAILGLSRWGTPLSVWLEKKGEIESGDQSESMYWGTVVEPAIRTRYMEQTGRKVWKPDGVIRHPVESWMLGSPDGIVIGERRGVEIKMVDRFAADEWGEPFTDQAPAYYLVQCCHYMAITGFPVWDIAVLVGGNDFRIYTVRRDLAFEKTMIDRLREFWNEFVEGDVPPPMDGSSAASEWIERRFPREITEKPETADAVAIVWALRLDRAREALGVAEKEKATTENGMKEIIGERVGLVGDGWRATWKATKDRRVVDWKGVAVTLSAALDSLDRSEFVQGVVQDHTEDEPGSRRFLFTKRKRGGSDGGSE